MIILSTAEEVIERIERTDRPAKVCELCLHRLADNVFTYEFNDGEALFAEVCWQCLGDDDSALAIQLLGTMIERNEVHISIIDWLLGY